MPEGAPNLIGIDDVDAFEPNLIELEPAKIEGLRFVSFSLNVVPIFNEVEEDLMELVDPAFGVIQHTQFVLSASFDTRQVSHVHLEIEDNGLSWFKFSLRETAGFEVPGFEVIQQRHLSAVSGLDTKHVSHFHLVVFSLSVASGF